MERVRELLHPAGVLYADQTPARADGGLECVDVACTEFLTAMHTGGLVRSRHRRRGRAARLRRHHRPRRVRRL
jgi:hypothetical protein